MYANLFHNSWKYWVTLRVLVYTLHMEKKIHTFGLESAMLKCTVDIKGIFLSIFVHAAITEYHRLGSL